MRASALSSRSQTGQSPTVCCQQGRTQASSSVVHPVVHCRATPLLPACSCPCVHANAYSNRRWCCGDMVSCTPRATWFAAACTCLAGLLMTAWCASHRTSADHFACCAARCCLCPLSAAQPHLDLGVEVFREVSCSSESTCWAFVLTCVMTTQRMPAAPCKRLSTQTTTAHRSQGQGRPECNPCKHGLGVWCFHSRSVNPDVCRALCAVVAAV